MDRACEAERSRSKQGPNQNFRGELHLTSPYCWFACCNQPNSSARSYHSQRSKMPIVDPDQNRKLATRCEIPLSAAFRLLSGLNAGGLFANLIYVKAQERAAT